MYLIKSSELKEVIAVITELRMTSVIINMGLEHHPGQYPYLDTLAYSIYTPNTQTVKRIYSPYSFGALPFHFADQALTQYYN